MRTVCPVIAGDTHRDLLPSQVPQLGRLGTLGSGGTNLHSCQTTRPLYGWRPIQNAEFFSARASVGPIAIEDNRNKI